MHALVLGLDAIQVRLGTGTLVAALRTVVGRLRTFVAARAVLAWAVCVVGTIVRPRPIPVARAIGRPGPIIGPRAVVLSASAIGVGPVALRATAWSAVPIRALSIGTVAL
ncbi:MAG: hypothetical protein AB7O52_10530 [Planctomycetota bacterium]